MNHNWIAPNPVEEELFWHFVWARQECFYNRKVLGLPREQWTTDEVIARARFTNAYRELDRGTQFGVEHVLERHAHEGPELAVAHSMTYRWFNRIATYIDVEPLVGLAYEGDREAFEVIAQLLDERLDAKQKVFTGAYMCSYAPAWGHPTKGWDYAESLRYMYQLVRERFVPLMESPQGSLRQLYAVLESSHGFGPFLAYQCCLDLMYPLVALGGGRVARHADVDSWTQPGPGCTKGLLLLGVKGTDSVQVRALRALHAKHVDVLHPLGFRWLRTHYGSSLQLSLGNIENCFCEYSKWRRMVDGGHVKTLWSEPAAWEWQPGSVTLPYYGNWYEPETGRLVASKWAPEAEDEVHEHGDAMPSHGEQAA